LVIIDHGGGYLSLYGNCESVLRSEGDWVEAGEPIATTGRSGALSIDGLYLELRRRTTTLDPKLWLARRR
jgi:septal ring factor EnvC (AmiA/AmiB activator)